MPIAKESRSPDASKLSFPLQLVIGIVAAFGAMWASTYGLRSDVRDILTRMEGQAAIAAEQAKLQEQRAIAESKLQDERAGAMKEAVADMRRRQELQQYEIQQLSKTITAIEQRMKP